jgi:hypothetical protein
LPGASKAHRNENGNRRPQQRSRGRKNDLRTIASELASGTGLTF